MPPITIAEIAAVLNEKAKTHPIGELQVIRKSLHNLEKLPGRDIFRPETTDKEDKWAFHYGGSTELQFNIGRDRTDTTLRHGVAFSFEPSQTLPSPDVLVPKVRRFNDYLDLHPRLYADMWMWHFDKTGRSTNYIPGRIPPELVRRDVFVFLGRLGPIDNLDYDVFFAILTGSCLCTDTLRVMVAFSQFQHRPLHSVTSVPDARQKRRSLPLATPKKS
jgi:hypothetical protein